MVHTTAGVGFRPEPLSAAHLRTLPFGLISTRALHGSHFGDEANQNGSGDGEEIG